MTSVTELALYDLRIGEPAFAADPTPHFQAAWRQHPWLAKSDVGYVITQYQAMKDVLSMDANLQSSAAHLVTIMGAEGTPWARFALENLNAVQGETHARVRNTLAHVFTPRAVNTYRTRMRKAVSQVLDEWAPKGAFDFMEFAANFPIAVMFGLVGAPHEAIPKIMWTLEAVGQSFNLDPEFFPTLNAAFNELFDFVDKLVLERQAAGATGHEDLLDALVELETTGQLTPIEVRHLLIFLFVGGYDTSKNMLGHVLYLLLDHPQYWERCAEDRAFCDKVVEETFRHSSAATTYRDVKEAFEYRGVHFPKGTMLIFPLSMAGRDPTAFPDPMRFDPERVHTNRHIAFGRGGHICIGQFLARAQIEEGLHQIAQRVTKPRLAGTVTWRPFPGVWGIASLPIEFVPAPKRPERDADARAAA